MRKHDAKDVRMTKFYALIAACMVFAPVALVTLSQATQIIA
jgi:hypothetical protein